MNRPQTTRAALALLAAALLSAPMARADEYDDVAQYDWTQSRAPLAGIEAKIRQATTPAEQKKIEVKLIEILRNPEATYGGKQFACRALRRVGSAECVPALAALLTDEKLSHMARFALERLQAPQATSALRSALGQVTGPLKIGVVTSIGQRRDDQATPALAALLAGKDEALALAAIRALGTIASPAAAKVLSEAKVSPAHKSAQLDAFLLCADQMLADGNPDAAGKIYQSMFAAAYPKPIRIAALRGIVLSRKDQAAEALLALMKDEDVDLRRAAGKFVVEMPGEAATKAFSSKLDSLPPDGQITLLGALTARADTAAAGDVTHLVTSSVEKVRIAAIEALAVLGDGSSVPMLAKAVAGGGAVGHAAVSTLNRLKGEGVGQAMSRLLDSPNPKIRAGILQVMTARADRTVAPAMLKAARDTDPAIRAAAVKGLTVVAAERELPDLIALLVANKDTGEQAALARAVSAAAGRAGEPAAGPVVAGLAKASPAVKVHLVAVLGRVGGARALSAVRGQLQSPDAEVATEAVRALQAWPDAAPADDLLGIIKTARNPVHKALAFRGYIRMANMPGVRTPAQTTGMYEQALALAGSAEEKKAVLAGLAGASSAEALKMVEGLLGEAALKAEAELALVQIASNARDAAPNEARAALRKIVATSDNAGLKDQAKTVLGEMDKFAGYVRSWLGAGPFKQGDPFGTAFPPEKPGATGVQWKKITKGLGPQTIDLARAIGSGNNQTAYLKTSIYSPTDQAARLDLGSDDGIKVWVGGKLVHANNATRPCTPGQDKANAQLKKGWNPVLVKISQGGGQWAVSFRIVKADGTAIEGMRVGPDVK